MAGGDYSSTFSYRGRLGRAQYWAGLVLVLVIGIVLLGAAAPYVSTTGLSVGSALATTALAALFFWLLSLVMIRRLHDRDMSGWWFALFGVLPVLLFYGSLQIFHVVPQSYEAQRIAGPFAVGGQIVALALFAWGVVALGLQAGTPGDNRYGPAPWGTKTE